MLSKKQSSSSSNLFQILLKLCPDAATASNFATIAVFFSCHSALTFLPQSLRYLAQPWTFHSCPAKQSLVRKMEMVVYFLLILPCFMPANTKADGSTAMSVIAAQAWIGV